VANKHAVEGLTKSAALEAAAAGVRQPGRSWSLYHRQDDRLVDGGKLA